MPMSLEHHVGNRGDVIVGNLFMKESLIEFTKIRLGACQLRGSCKLARN